MKKNKYYEFEVDLISNLNKILIEYFNKKSRPIDDSFVLELVHMLIESVNEHQGHERAYRERSTSHVGYDSPELRLHIKEIWEELETFIKNYKEIKII